MTRGIRVALALAVALGSMRLFALDEPGNGHDEKVDGYAEFRLGDCLVADAQRVCPAPGFKFTGEGEAKDFASIPLGYELKAKGRRRADGTLLAREVEAKPNGSALFEGEIKAATDQAETQARNRGGFVESDGGKERDIGRLYEDGPPVERVRHIVDSLLPPYLHPEDVRIYVIQNEEWNAFAMGNYSIYVFTGLLDDMDDDEVAIVLGHELVHATHEHSRKQFKRDMWASLITAGVLGAVSTIDDDKKQAVAALIVLAGSTAYKSGYGRGMEDQADRVGLRYAYEAGYDITKGPRLWNRFANKYGEGNKVASFFFSDHSQSAARATKLAREIAFNYRDGPKPDGPVRPARRAPRAGPPTVAAAPTAVPVGAPALTGGVPPAPPLSTSPAPGASGGAGPGTKRVRIKAGMTTDEVREALGNPDAEVVLGGKTQWTYPDFTVVFASGKVTDVRF